MPIIAPGNDLLLRDMLKNNVQGLSAEDAQNPDLLFLAMAQAIQQWLVLPAVGGACVIPAPGPPPPGFPGSLI